MMKPGDRLKAIEEARSYRRNLPHIEEPGSVYFITFKTKGENVLNDEAKDVVFDGIKFHAGKKYRLYACIVMETHVHFIIKPLKEPNGRFPSIAQILHSIKSYSAHQINKILNRTGSIWQNENYDRIVRNDEEWLGKMSYIQNNPVKAGIVQKPEDYRWLFLDSNDE